MLLEFIDFHCHFLSSNAIYCTAQPVSRQALPIQQQPFLYCEGLLPQYWTVQKQEMLVHNLQAPASILRPHHFGEVNLGEVGLDKRFQAKVSLQEQEENLLALLKEAKRLDKLVTIHSVQATERTINVLMKAQLKPWKTIWHGFNGSLETAQILYKLGVFISLGPRSIGPRVPKQDLKALAKVHPNFVLETDYEGADQTQYNNLLQEHYQNCATQLGWSLEKLKEHCYGQAQTLTN